MLYSPGTIIDGRFEIISIIGSGGLGAVYKAFQKDLGRYVAVKVLLAHIDRNIEEQERLHREAMVLSKLQHDNIVSFYGFGVWNKHPYVVLEYVEGKSLSACINKNQPLDFRSTLNIMRQVCAALKCAHSQGVVHRDLKPVNIMVCTADGQTSIKVIDFGLAKLLPEFGPEVQKLTKTGSTVGSVLYMSPEQCSGIPVDARSDIYSLAAVMHECLTGSPLFWRDSDVAVMFAHLKDEPQRLNNVDASVENKKESLDALLLKALSKHPDDRYQVVDEFVNDLESIAVGSTIKPKWRSRAIGPGTRLPAPLRWGGIVVLFLCIGVIARYMLQPQTPIMHGENARTLLIDYKRHVEKKDLSSDYLDRLTKLVAILRADDSDHSLSERERVLDAYPRLSETATTLCQQAHKNRSLKAKLRPLLNEVCNYFHAGDHTNNAYCGRQLFALRLASQLDFLDPPDKSVVERRTAAFTSHLEAACPQERRDLEDCWNHGILPLNNRMYGETKVAETIRKLENLVPSSWSSDDRARFAHTLWCHYAGCTATYKGPQITIGLWRTALDSASKISFLTDEDRIRTNQSLEGMAYCQLAFATDSTLTTGISQQTRQYLSEATAYLSRAKPISVVGLPEYVSAYLTASDLFYDWFSDEKESDRLIQQVLAVLRVAKAADDGAQRIVIKELQDLSSHCQIVHAHTIALEALDKALDRSSNLARPNIDDLCIRILLVQRRALSWDELGSKIASRQALSESLRLVKKLPISELKTDQFRTLADALAEQASCARRQQFTDLAHDLRSEACELLEKMPTSSQQAILEKARAYRTLGNIASTWKDRDDIIKFGVLATNCDQTLAEPDFYALAEQEYSWIQIASVSRFSNDALEQRAWDNAFRLLPRLERAAADKDKTQLACIYIQISDAYYQPRRDLKGREKLLLTALKLPAWPPQASADVATMQNRLTEASICKRVADDARFSGRTETVNRMIPLSKKLLAEDWQCFQKHYGGTTSNGYLPYIMNFFGMMAYCKVNNMLPVVEVRNALLQRSLLSKLNQRKRCTEADIDAFDKICNLNFNLSSDHTQLKTAEKLAEKMEVRKSGSVASLLNAWNYMAANAIEIHEPALAARYKKHSTELSVVLKPDDQDCRVLADRLMFHIAGDSIYSGRQDVADWSYSFAESYFKRIRKPVPADKIMIAYCEEGIGHHDEADKIVSETLHMPQARQQMSSVPAAMFDWFHLLEREKETARLKASMAMYKALIDP